MYIILYKDRKRIGLIVDACVSFTLFSLLCFLDPDSLVTPSLVTESGLFYKIWCPVCSQDTRVF